MGAEGVGGGTLANVFAVGQQPPGQRLIAQIGAHDLVQHLAMHRLVLDRHQRLDAPVEVARNPIGRGDEDFRLIRRQLVAVAEADDSAMLEEPADDALNANVIREAGNDGP